VIIDSAKRGAFGVILVTKRGYTLYYDKSDSATKIACVGGCAQIWPPVLLSSDVHSAEAGPGVAQNALGVMHRRGGGVQVTYAGHSLYSYVGDAVPGQTNGEGVGGFYVVKASASRSPTTPTTTTPSGGGGYGGY
jgi:predicted lipoprotein with Yx(FWY)xxD motif